MRGIVLQAPWAPAVALGIKGWETRGYQPRTTLQPGDDLAIVCGLSPQAVWDLPGDCEGKTEAGHVYGYVTNDHQAGYCIRTSDEGTRGDVFLSGPGTDEPSYFTAGTVLAVVTYAGALPISASPDDIAPRIWLNEWANTLFHVGPGTPSDAGTYETRPVTEITEQLPWGEFTHGRWAWELTNVRRLTDPVPCPARQPGQPGAARVSMQGVFTLPGHVEAAVSAQLEAAA